MLRHWIIATLISLGLGLLLYYCVRLRMHFGPLLRDRYGEAARRILWFGIILLMVGVANAMLYVLRFALEAGPPVDNPLILEIWFALLATAVALLLVFRRCRPGSDRYSGRQQRF